VTGVALDNSDEHYADGVVSNMTFPRTWNGCKRPGTSFLKKYAISKLRVVGQAQYCPDGLGPHAAIPS
jgi:hypothetical protein